MLALKRLTFLAVALGLALSGLSLSAVSAADHQPAASAAQQEEGGAWLGVSIADGEEGASVMEVTPGSPADEAGLRAGDVITAVDGEAIESADGLVDLIATYAPGDEITVTAEFRGVSTDYAVTLGERPADLGVTPPGVQTMPNLSRGGTFNLFGLTASLADDGLVIESLEDDSPFADSGLQEGDVITQINGEDVTAGVGSLMGAFRLGEPLTFTIDRAGEEITVEVDLSALLPNLELPDIELPQIDIRPGQGLGFGSMVAGMLGLDAEMTDEGLLINEIADDSPLTALDLQAGDVVTEVNGISLLDFEPGAMADLLADLAPGGTLTLTVLRDGAETTVEVALPESFSFEIAPGQGFGFRRGQGPMMGAGQPAQLGVQFAILTPALADERGLDVEEGALIEQVFEDTPAAAAGLQEGDVITAVEGDLVDQQRTLSERLAAYDEGEVVALTILRGGEELELSVTLGPRSSGNFGMFRRGPNGEGGMFFFGPGMTDEEFFELHPFFERERRFGEGRGPRQGGDAPRQGDGAPRQGDGAPRRGGDALTPAPPTETGAAV